MTSWDASGCSPSGFTLSGVDVYGALSINPSIAGNIQNLKRLLELRLLKNIIASTASNSLITD